MSYFSKYVMPKRLARETSSEVDRSPLIYNAADYNRHHREILAIEQFFIGIAGSGASGFSGYFDGSGFSSFSGFSGVSRGTSGLYGVVQEVDDLLAKMIDDGLMSTVAGYVSPDTYVPIPTNVINATINGPIAATDTTIPCDLAYLFPKRGYLTKFNSVDVRDHCSTNVVSFSGACSTGELYKDYGPFVDAAGFSSMGHMTNQEFIWYEARTDDSFGPCTRGSDGTTAQDLVTDDSAVILPGRASLMLSSYAWAKASGFSGFRQFVVAHSSDLFVQAAGFSGASDKIDDYYRVGYCLSITPNFDDVNISSAYEG